MVLHMSHSWCISFYIVLQLSDKVPIVRFEPRIPFIVSDHSANCATITANNDCKTKLAYHTLVLQNPQQLVDLGK